MLLCITVESTEQKVDNVYQRLKKVCRQANSNTTLLARFNAEQNDQSRNLNKTSNLPNKQVIKKPVESSKSQLFKIKRTFIRTLKALDLMMKQNFDTNIMEVINTFDSPTRDELLSKNINELFSTIDTKLGSII